MGEVMIPAMIWDLQERVPADASPSEELPSMGQRRLQPNRSVKGQKTSNSLPITRS